MKKESAIVIVVCSILIVGSGITGWIFGSKYSDLENKLILEKEKSKKQEEKNIIPRKSNEYFEKLLKPYEYVPDNFITDNVSDEFLAKFILNYYTLYDKTYSSNRYDENGKETFNVPKSEVEETIEEYFYIEDKELKDYSFEIYQLKNKNNNYKIYVSPVGMDNITHEVTNIDYDDENNEVDVNYNLIDPYSQETIGTKVIKLKYYDDDFKVVSLKIDNEKQN